MLVKRAAATCDILPSSSGRRLEQRPLHHARLHVESRRPSGRTTAQEERERELAGEFNRWYDLVCPGADYFVNRVRLYNPHAASVVEKHALRPIPQSQIDGVVEGPKYPQNPLY